MSRVSLSSAAAGRRAVGLCALTISLAAGAVVAAASSVTGNARAIAFERTAYAVDNRAPGYRLSESGYFAMRALPSASGGVRFALDWGTGIVPGGWTAAIGSASYALQGGRVTGVDLVVSPAAQSSPDVSIEVLTTRHGVFWRPYRRRACFTPWRVKPAFEAAVGTALFVMSGHFDAPPSRFTTSLTVGTRNETIHATVRRLRAAGLVHVQASPSDRRALLIDLSDAGRALLEAVLPDADAANRRTLAALGAGEQRTLIELLRRLASADAPERASGAAHSRASGRCRYGS